MELPGRRPKGKPKRRILDVVRGHGAVGGREEGDRVRWRQKIGCSEP